MSRARRKIYKARGLSRGGEAEAGCRRRVHPIEARSFEVLRRLLDLSDLGPLSRSVTERIVHATADPAWCEDLVCDEEALRQGWEALRAGAPVVADVGMTAAGITSRPVVCAVDLASAPANPTRSAAGIRRAAAEVGAGAVWVVGCAPTALQACLEWASDPALVIGLPVGFIGAVEAKEALLGSGLPALSNRSAKGGAAAAAAACNALLYWDER